jgi:NADH-quinone oxidoreductase subunit J
LSSVILASAVVVISARNPVHSLLFLILVFLNIVFVLMLLRVEFMAFTFLIIYVGAVAVLFLFIVMMLNIKIIKLNEELIQYLPIAGMVAVLFLCNIFFFVFRKDLFFSSNSEFSDQLTYTNWFELVDSTSSIDPFSSLYTYFFSLLLISGVILLVAIIGAIVLTFRGKGHSLQQSMNSQVSRDFEKAIFLIKEKK